jgi:AraC-like DNA-binding protein
MRAVLDRRSYTELSTSAVAQDDAFAYWREVICAAFVRLAADPVAGPVADQAFAGRVEHLPIGPLELSTVTAGGQHVRRTRSMAAAAGEEYLLASIQLSGRGRVEQDGRCALLSAGDMAFYDSTRPYVLHFDDPFRQLVVMVPKPELGLRDTRALTARRLGRGGPGAAISAFFVALSGTAGQAPSAAALLPHAVGLLAAGASFAARTGPTGERAHDALARERVGAFLRRHLDDPRLDADAVARGCGVSRSTLYRIVGDEGVSAQLRRMRMDRAKRLLVEDPARPVGAVATACGFDSESGFHRAFRAATGRTPGAYRRDAAAGPPSG